MPAGKTHEKINWHVLHSLIFSVLLGGCYYLFGFRGVIDALLLIGGYLFGTYYFGPDLDTKSTPFYRWGILRFLWKPYQKMFHHRSVWTHGFLIGDMVRLMYVFFWLMIPTSALYVVANPTWQAIVAWFTETIQTNRIGCVFFILGVVTASTVHIASDRWASLSKRIKPKRKQKKRSK